MEHTGWFKDRVFYQIWPRSFYDGDNDGMGDLWGVLQKLDYIKSLGCDGIWFSPLYPSPGVDCGYDVADYMDIDPRFGGMEAFEKVLEEAHKRDMKVIMDLVVNHTSDQHPWFQLSRLKVDPYTDYYIWRPAGKNGKLPNNWDSLFEGKAWQYDELRGEYYLHLFSVGQPDLNMDNPRVREEVKKILRFWLEKGVDGFREDVITFISKVEGLPNDLLPAAKGLRKFNHGPHIHEYLSEFQRDVLSRYDCVTLAESPVITPRMALRYIEEGPEQEIDMMIQFETAAADCFLVEYLPLPFSLRRLKAAFSRWQKILSGRGWNMLYLENHDHPRVISRYGSEEYRVESGKALAAAYLFQQGTPFVYQGQEIGMLNWHPRDPEEYEDVQTLWHYRNRFTFLGKKLRLRLLWRASRDSARTPLQWSGEKNAGFTKAEKPWFTVNDNYREINAEKEERDPDSVLNFYRKAIALRKSLKAVRYGNYREYDRLSGRRYVYSREFEGERLLVICSFSKKEQRFRAPRGFSPGSAELLLQNYPDAPEGRLRPYECRVYRWER